MASTTTPDLTSRTSRADMAGRSPVLSRRLCALGLALGVPIVLIGCSTGGDQAKVAAAKVPASAVVTAPSSTVVASLGAMVGADGGRGLCRCTTGRFSRWGPGPGVDGHHRRRIRQHRRWFGCRSVADHRRGSCAGDHQLHHTGFDRLSQWRLPGVHGRVDHTEHREGHDLHRRTRGLQRVLGHRRGIPALQLLECPHLHAHRSQFRWAIHDPLGHPSTPQRPSRRLDDAVVDPPVRPGHPSGRAPQGRCEVAPGRPATPGRCRFRR